MGLKFEGEPREQNTKPAKLALCRHFPNLLTHYCHTPLTLKHKTTLVWRNWPCIATFSPKYKADVCGAVFNHNADAIISKHAAPVYWRRHAL